MKKTFDFIKLRKVFFILSLAYIGLGFGLFFYRGLNLDIDFTSGTMIEVYIEEAKNDAEVKKITDEFDTNIHITRTGTEGKNVVLRTTKNFSTEELNGIKKAFKDSFGVSADQISSRTIEASMGDEIRNKAILGIVLVSIAVLIYVSMRFKFDYGVAAVVALIHDVSFMFATYSIFSFAVNSSFVAAILTVLGYSINDTIVIFDRVRENIKKHRSKGEYEILNMSVSQSMTRTIFTSLTTFAVIAILFFLGVLETKTLALSMMIGTVIGTYSTIFIASPLWYMIRSRKSR